MKKPDFKKHVQKIKENTKPYSSPPIKRVFVNNGVISIGQLLKMDFKEPAWTVKNLIPSECISIISGSPGNFKTWLVLHMGIMIAKGEKFIGEFPCTQSGVLIVDEEDHLRYLKERLLMLGGTEELPLYLMSFQGFKIDDPSWRKKVLDICKEKNIKTVFFDSLVRIHKGNENESGAMAQIFEAFRTFCKSKITVVITHHERKEGKSNVLAKDRLRGSGDIFAALDSHLAVKRDRETECLKIEHAKLKMGKEQDPFDVTIDLQENKVSFQHVAVRHKKEVVREQAENVIREILSGEKLSIKEVVEKSKEKNISEKTAKDTLKGMIERGLVAKEKGSKNSHLCSLPKTEP